MVKTALDVTIADVDFAMLKLKQYIVQLYSRRH